MIVIPSSGAADEQLKQQWLSGLGDLVNKISTPFSALVQQVGAKGEVKLASSGPLKRFGLEVHVGFDDEESSCLSRSHSSRERIVATQLYLLAMQHLVKAPFRCLDLIYPLHATMEEKIFKLILFNARARNQPQRFVAALLHPSTVTSMEEFDSNHVKVHKLVNCDRLRS